MSEPVAAPKDVTVAEIFWAFLLIGATSFGGGVVAYLRSSLVAKHQWIDDKTFVEFLSIGQTLPGLNATNMAVLVGDRLRGAAGAIAAVTAICLPGALLMFAAGVPMECMATARRSPRSCTAWPRPPRASCSR